MTVKARIIRRLVIGLVVAMATLFVTAGSLRFWQAWLFLLVTFGFVLPTTLRLANRDPALAERRLRYDEKEPAQKRLKVVLSLIFFPALLLPGLDFRFGWSRNWMGPIPHWVVL